MVGAVTGQHEQAGVDGSLVGECLGRAASFVRLASVRLSERARDCGALGYEDAVALMTAGSTQVRLDQVMSVLEDGCGSVPDAELLADGLAGVGPGGVGDALQLLYAADREFDRVPLGLIPLRLPSARAELAGAVLSLRLEDDIE